MKYIAEGTEKWETNESGVARTFDLYRHVTEAVDQAVDKLDYLNALQDQYTSIMEDALADTAYLDGFDAAVKDYDEMIKTRTVMWTRLVATYIQEESAPKKEVEVEDKDADTNAVAVDGDQRKAKEEDLL